MNAWAEGLHDAELRGISIPTTRSAVLHDRLPARVRRFLPPQPTMHRPVEALFNVLRLLIPSIQPGSVFLVPW